ncbi:MAG: chromosome segregation protein SMC [Acidobacteriota bacterium]|nr:chromosome segregation protein SMC [Acidobacteriota bacterium]
MLKIQRVQLSGFKSFPDDTTVEFAGGLTAIVGPNGCGKSNIADAVIWGLGERSAKSLRGGKMEDVIFAGSEGRKALGMAEVRLDMTTDPGFEGADDGRLAITRQVFRAGEGRYFVNGKPSRLKDIRSLLMDTGLGLRGYSMIEQGQIGMILSGKPQERRKLLEEAAGITRYKDRRRIAEVKLEEARGNLARLDDILSEVGRAVRSLKRQAAAARRYREAQSRRAELLRAVLLGRWSRVHGELVRLKREIASRVDREAELSADLHRDEAELAERRRDEEGLTRRLAERHRRDSDLAARIEGKQEFVKGARQRRQEVTERIAASRGLIENQRARQAELRNELAVLGDRERELAAELAAAASELSHGESRITDVAQLVSEAEARLESTRGSLLTSLSAVNDLRNRLHREQVESEKGELRLSHLRSALAENAKQAAEARRAAAQAAEHLAAAGAEAGEHGRGLAVGRARLASLEEATESRRERRHELKDELVALEQRRELLAELVAARHERRRRLAETLAAAGLPRVTLLSERLRVPEGWARSLDLFLGELADAAILPSDEDGLRLARFLRDDGAGGRLIRSLAAPAPAAPLADAAVLSPLGAALALPAELAAALPPAYLVESAADAERLARAHPGAAFLAREGLWAEAGVLHVAADGARPGLLASEEEVASLEERIPPLGERLTATAREIDELAGQARDCRESLVPLEESLAASRERIAVLEARGQDLAARERRLAVERETLETEVAETEREIEIIAERRRSLQLEFTRAETRHEELEQSFDALQREAGEARRQREETSTAGADRRGRHRLVEQRLESHRRGAERIAAEIDEVEARIAGWHQESATLEARKAEIEDALARAEGELQSALEERAVSQDDLAGAQRDLDARRAALQEIDARLGVLREERDQVRTEIGDLRVERAAHGQDAEHLQAEFHKELAEDLPDIPAEAPPNLPEIEVDFERCEALLERLGPVNLLAAEEHAEQVERLEFLSTQRADVASSVEKLRDTIRKLNAESSERFRKTFAEVNVTFSETFTELFRGGQASMRLLDEDDPLDSGIEIVARPPGKRLQNLMLLSGGEKALTAIALLFGLFRTKPSPFCILDEVDAPLDDLNTVRFVQLVQKMAAETQFVIITHNKITMEAASVLYGVTMQERGVSKLVAVELDDVHPRQEALSA